MRDGCGAGAQEREEEGEGSGGDWEEQCVGQWGGGEKLVHVGTVRGED